MNFRKFLFIPFALAFAWPVFAADESDAPAQEVADKVSEPAACADNENCKKTRKEEIKTLDLVLILDESGSMQGLESDTIGGFNSMIEKQKKLKIDTYVTTVVFSSSSKTLHDRVKIADVKPMTDNDYRTGGTTALLDAVGIAINNLDKIENINAKDHKVIVVIITDGQENSSREYNKQIIKNLISERQEKYEWDFLFLGANIDSVGEATSMGINAANAVKYKNSQSGVRANYDAVATFAEEAVSAEPAEGSSWKDKIEEDK